MDLIRLENENLVYLKTKDVILKNINLVIEHGEQVLITGINGAGKSTLFKALLNFIGTDGERYAELQNGLFYFCDSLERKNLNCQIINIPQDDYIGKPFSKVEDVLLTAIPSDVKNKKLYLKNWLNRYRPMIKDDERNHLLKKRIISLSGGQKKFIAILQGLIRCDDINVKLALLDEPVNNLDAKHIIQVSDLLNRIQFYRPEFSIVLITHCHAFPNISRAYEISNQEIKIIKYHPHNCFGHYDEDGYYQKEMNPKKEIV